MSDDAIRALTNPAFRFVVDVDGEAQAAFTDCTLPAIEWEIEEIKEGGLNTFTHQLPGRRKGTKVTLKNGVGSSSLIDWYVDTMSESFQRKPLTITLLNSQLETVMTWHVADAYPVKWTGPSLKSSDNSIAIQTLELACGEVSVSS
ncbi:MAG: phage tail protein [Anaerolineae bacterium]